MTKQCVREKNSGEGQQKGCERDMGVEIIGERMRYEAV